MMLVKQIKQFISIKLDILFGLYGVVVSKVIVLYTKFYINCNNNLKYCYIIPFIFKTLGKEIPADAEPIVTFSFNILILALIILFCFINITGYFISIYLINKYNVESKYPKYYKIIRYFEQSRILFVTIEIFLCLFCLILIIILNLGILGIFIFV
uniref:hypothetical protein n=1 Tax=Porodaedalea niemelaei TaxID=175858 RepID=UPI0023AAE22D|nr:hypothetical protein P1R16_mgp02 [Porodaedalea niemelaei]WCF76633.1 hypothetical protein [Porodaedalea niemelaei]